MGKTKIIFLLFFSFAFVKSEAQKDTLHTPKTFNQVYVGVLGDNDLISIVSLNYSKKLPHGIIVFGGMGNPRKVSSNNNQPSFNSFTFDAGLLFRGKYKRNGLWGSLSASIATGKWFYVTNYYTYWTYINSVYQRVAVYNYTYHDIDFEILPAVCYQFQNKNEKLFCRITGGVKLFSSLFLNSYDDKIVDHNDFFPWIGISIGGAW